MPHAPRTTIGSGRACFPLNPSILMPTISNHNLYNQTSHAFNPRSPRFLRAGRIGPVTKEAVLYPGVAFTRLFELPDGGVLLLSPDQRLVILRSDGAATVLKERIPDVWNVLPSLGIAACPGDGRLPRFWRAYEAASDGFPSYHALVDLLTLEVLGRSSESEVKYECERANRDPARYLGWAHPSGIRWPHVGARFRLEHGGESIA